MNNTKIGMVLALVLLLPMAAYAAEGTTGARRVAPVSSDDSLQITLTSMQARINALESQLKMLLARIGSTLDSLKIQTIVDIEQLKAEDQFLRQQLDSASRAYASVDDVPMPPAGDAANSVASETPSSPALAYSGWVYLSNSIDHNTGQSTFALDEVEVDVESPVSSRAAVRADVEMYSNLEGGYEFNLEQGYFSYALGEAHPWVLSFGKFNSPIGSEARNQDDVSLYTYSLVYEFGHPSNLVGFSSDLTVSEQVSWRVYAANGWDVDADNNQDKTFGTRIGLAPMKGLEIGLSAISGAEQEDNDSSRRTVLDADLTFTPSEAVTVAADVTVGRETHLLEDGTNADWRGGMLAVSYALTEQWSVYTRGDYFHDLDGSRTGAPQERKAIALVPVYQLTDALSASFEIRHDWSNFADFAGDNEEMKTNQVASAIFFNFGF